MCPMAPCCLGHGWVCRCCCCRGGAVPPFTWLSVSVPGAAEKPYMVEEAVSYNELDYISVSQARGSSHLPRGEGGFVSMGSEPLRLGELAVMPLAVPPLWVPMSLHGQQSDH